jgi:ribonuclease III
VDLVKIASPENDISGLFSKLPQIIALKKKLGHSFRNPDLILHAFAHASFVHENPDLVDQSYERMEFLGDAILGAVVTESLFHLHPDMDEGHASRMRSVLVNESTLHELAILLGLSGCLLMGKGEVRTKGNERSSVLANAFEAVVAAVFLDSSFEKTKKVMGRIFTLYKETTGRDFYDASKMSQADAKGRLQEWCMVRHMALPEYKVVGQDKNGFRIVLLLGGNEVATAVHTSKKEAQKILAREALKKIEIESPLELEGEKSC